MTDNTRRVDEKALRHVKRQFKGGHDIGAMWIEAYELAKASEEPVGE